ncbi:MAG: MFS transporter, partial [Proteobacteria bacterium]|nr:MFS transporter [Pseudomonadota bacterium]
RGTVIGVLQAFSAFGAITCAGLMPLMVSTDLGWRLVYFVGIIPLLLLAYARRGLKETARFEKQKAEGRTEPPPMFEIFNTPHRRRVFQLGIIWLVTYACSNTAVSFFELHATEDLNWTKKDVSDVLTISAIVSLPLVFFAGKLLDMAGRKKAAVLIFVATSVGVFLGYTLESKYALTIVMTVAVFGVNSVLPVLNAFTSELFPTEHRAAAFGWTNNLIGRLGYVLAPIGIGLIAAQTDWGRAIAPTAIFPLIALALILWWLPETNAIELEESAALGGS